MKKASLPLSSTTVLDLSQVLSGPFCTQILADLGANVIKVEPPGGDGTRKWGPPFVGGESAYFLSVNRNKRSVVIDLKSAPEALGIVKKIAKKADVVIENFRPGVAKELGVSYDVMKKVNPSIIYCSISGYGQSGPLSSKPGYDIAAFAASGIMSITGEKNSTPVKVGVPVADIGAGMYAAIAIISSLFARQKSRKGAYIDISMFDSMLSWLTFQAGTYFVTGENPVALGSAHPIIAPYQAFRARDRSFILAVGNDSLWRKTARAMDMMDLAEDPGFASNASRIARREELAEILERKLIQQDAAFWLERFESAGVPCSPLNSVGEALESAHARARSMIMQLIHPRAGKIKAVGNPIKTENFRTRKNLPPPLLGQHSEKILLELGYSKREIEDLRERQIIR